MFAETSKLPNFDELRTDLEKMAAPLSQVSSYVSQLKDLEQFVSGTGTFFDVDLNYFLANLTVRTYAYLLPDSRCNNTQSTTASLHESGRVLMIYRAMLLPFERHS